MDMAACAAFNPAVGVHPGAPEVAGVHPWLTMGPLQDNTSHRHRGVGEERSGKPPMEPAYLPGQAVDSACIVCNCVLNEYEYRPKPRT